MIPARWGVLLVVGFEAGLLTGLSRFWAPLGASALLTLVFVAHPRARALLAALALGTGAGRIGHMSDQATCAARLPAGALHIVVRLHDSGNARGIMAAAPVGAGCRGTVMLRLPHPDTLPAGTILQVAGQWLPRVGLLGKASGILLARQVRADGIDPTVDEQLRAWLSRHARGLFGARAPLVEALVLGSRGGLDIGLRNAFAQAGLVHLLSISGFHVGLIVAWVVLLGQLVGLGRRRALWAGAGTGLAYAAFLGWPAPATRAAILCVLVAWQLQRQRHTSLGHLVCLTCLLVSLNDPWAIASPGAWLSVSALLGAAWVGRWCAERLSRAGWIRLLGSSAGATIATAPVTAGVFGMVPVAGIVLNLIAIPLAAVAVPGVVASLLLAGLVPPVARSLAAGAGLCLHLLELVARFGAAIPGGCLVVTPSVFSAVVAAAALLAARWALGRFVTARVAGQRLAFALMLASWLPLLAYLPGPGGDGASGLALHFLDVGQGDGAVIRTPHGHWILVDAGPRSDVADAGRAVVLPFLRRHRVRRLDAMVISHAHADHVGGAAAVLDGVPVGTVLEPAELVADPLYGEFLAAAAADATEWRAARRGMRFTIDSVTFAIVHPDTAWAEWGLDLNEDSAMLLVSYGGFRALLAGDAGLRAEAELHGSVGPVDLLKVGHHGSRTATGDAWLAELRPGAAVISVGQRNRYGHPSVATLTRLAAHHASIFRTDRDGTVTVTSDGTRYTVRGHDRRETYAVHPEERQP